jgi:hypothetical protein
MKNPYLETLVWVGDHYDDPANPLYRAVIVCESTYDTIPDDPYGIKWWIFRKGKDWGVQPTLQRHAHAYARL